MINTNHGGKMKLITILLALLFMEPGLSAEENRETESYYRHCYGIQNNFASFESCVNSNFNTASTEFSTYLSYCYGSTSNAYSLESCVNNNFSRLSSLANVFLSHCYGIQNSPASFESCVNSNFSRLSYVLEYYYDNY